MAPSSTTPSGITAPQSAVGGLRSDYLAHRPSEQAARPGGLHDRLSVEQALELLPSLPDWPAPGNGKGVGRLRGARTILTWLLTHPGNGWQERWEASSADAGTEWLDALAARDDRTRRTNRKELINGLSCLLLRRIVRPSYAFLAAYKSFTLLNTARAVFSPHTFGRLEAAGVQAGMNNRHVTEGLTVITKIVLYTGRILEELIAEDVIEFRDDSVTRVGRTPHGCYAAWDLLRAGGVLPTTLSMRQTLLKGQRPTAEMVDAYKIRCRSIRDVLVRYLDERRPALDYGSFRGLVRALAKNFWADLEQHHPGIDSLHLPDDMAHAWKRRLLLVETADTGSRPRRQRLDILTTVRAFYLDIQEWALEDPSWAPWAVPCPVRRGDTAGRAKQKRSTTARMHQRVRERLPHLPVLIDAAERHLAACTALMQAAAAAPAGGDFEHDGTRYRRLVRRPYRNAQFNAEVTRIVIENLATGTATEVTVLEEDAFWAWAVIEVLRDTGLRVEELLELTHLALVSYRLSDTGELVPLLQVVPSKSNEERLLLVSPELASVLATIVTRLRTTNDGTIPLVARYDYHERVTDPPLPHLFQHKIGWRHQVLSPRKVQQLLNATMERTGLVDAAGEPLRYTPHDFRRIFATEAVTGGLPVHIAARLLGHASLTTTQAYLAVFQDDLVRAYRTFLERRRATRPQAEYREPTEQEWNEFQQHFELRKLELGTCGRPYGTPCKHEHACLTEVILIE
ncbi:tyrosine-type recombinase/integrase [Actinophytocola sp.]|uniref:tyrosine-type recombinase/integrase n=1 Tax=Actinophytocola sp. TaxID=1872138 RepID=UPI00389B0931